MNKLLFVVAAFLAATTADAGVRIETLTRDVKTKVADGGADAGAGGAAHSTVKSLRAERQARRILRASPSGPGFSCRCSLMGR